MIVINKQIPFIATAIDKNDTVEDPYTSGAGAVRAMSQISLLVNTFCWLPVSVNTSHLKNVIQFT